MSELNSVYRNRMRINNTDLDIVFNEKECQSFLRTVYIYNLEISELDTGSDGEAGIASLISSLEGIERDKNVSFLDSGKTNVKTKDIKELIDNCTKAVSDASDEVNYVAEIIKCNKALTGQGEGVDYTKLLMTTLLATSGEIDIHSTTLNKDIEDKYNSMTEEEIKEFLEKYISFTYVKSKYISQALMDANNQKEETKEEVNTNLGTSSRGVSRTATRKILNTASIPNPVKELENSPEPVSPVKTEPTKTDKVLNTNSSTTKTQVVDQKPKTVTKNTTSTNKVPISTTSTENDKTKIANIIGGTTKASSIGAVTRETLSSSNLPVNESTSKDLSDSIVDKVNLDNVSEGISGTLNSAIDTINKIKSNSPLKITKIKNMDMQDNSGNSFIPPIAGIASAAVAGVGTKMYIDKKDDDTEEKSDDFFSKEDQKEIKDKEEKKEDNNPFTKEDLIKAIEYGKR